ncbi:MAG TPA: hypothetical protein VEF34_14515 [Syntrophobacteraceae bacterium]|nr:hypothetical protein [Syntrophobacteraceae bacterium]
MRSMLHHNRLFLFVLVLVSCSAAGQKCRADEDSLKPVTEEIRFEACLPNQSDIGRPLPLAAHWNSGQAKGGFSPVYQMEMIKRGHFFLPWFHLPGPGEKPPDDDYYEVPMKWAAERGIPISFISTQWECYLTDSPEYFSLPSDRNPNVVNKNGSIEKKVSPFGPIGPWKELGRKWGEGGTLKKIQGWYPSPPLALFISNNEHPKLTWGEVENSSRYIREFGPGRDDNFKRKIVGDGWIVRYRALQDGMREGLEAKSWKDRSRFIAYNAFGLSCLGRWAGWIKYSLYTPGRFEPWPLAWDGASSPYYVHNWDGTTDFTVWSPQVESMNWVFMQQEAYRMNPGFWFEISTWDGQVDDKSDKRKFYRDMGQTYDPERYQGMAQFGMWLLRPRAVREFRGWTDTLANSSAYFLSIVNSVDRVHTNPVLRRFWRKGELVANPNGSHPYQSWIPEEYNKAVRWHLLDADANPKGPWQLGTQLSVFSLALVLGEAPEREWLLYAHSPLKSMDNVSIELPGYGRVAAYVTPAGCFYHVREKARSVERVF